MTRHGLHRLAQAHVVSQTCTGTPARQTGQPDEPFHLVITQLRLQRRRQHGRPAFGRPDTGDVLLPGGIRFHVAGVCQHRIQCRGTQRMHTPPRPVRFRHRGETLKLCLQLAGELDKASIAQRHEPAPRLVQPFQEEAHFQHLLLIQRDCPFDVEPVAVLCHPHLQVTGRDRTDPHRTAFRPFDGDRASIGPQFQQQFQTAVQVLDHQLVQVGATAIAERRTGLDQSRPLRQLTRQIPVGTKLLPRDGRQHGPAAKSRDVGWPVGAERTYHQPQLQPFLIRHQLHDRRGLPIHPGLIDLGDFRADR